MGFHLVVDTVTVEQADCPCYSRGVPGLVMVAQIESSASVISIAFLLIDIPHNDVFVSSSSSTYR